MRCTELKKRLNDGLAPDDPAVIEHVANCPSCARALRAARMVERALSDRTDEDPILSLVEVRAQIESTLAGRTAWEKIMTTVKDQYNSRPRLATGFALGLAAFLFVMLVPFSYMQTTGFQVTVTNAAADFQISPALLEGVLTTLGYENASVASNAVDRAVTVSNLPSESDARTLGRALAQLTGSEAEARVEPVRQRVRAPLYAQVVDRIKQPGTAPVRIRFVDDKFVINGRGIVPDWSSPYVSDSEVRKGLENILAQALDLASDVSVDVETDPLEEVRYVKLTVAEGLPIHYSLPDFTLVIDNRREIWASVDTTADSLSDPGIVMEFPGQRFEGRTIHINVILKTGDDE